MGMSPTKTGEMREDTFWLLKSSNSWAIYDSEEGHPIEPVTTIKVDYNTFKNSGNVQKYLNLHGTVFHGRRINNEVELFEWNNGKETPGLRAALEAKGLTVRTYVPESEVRPSKFPRVTYKAAMGKDAAPRSDFERCTDALKNGIAVVEEAHETSVDFAILADTGKKGNKMAILVCKMRAEEFYDLYDDAMDVVTWRGVAYQVLGAIDCGEVRLRCSDEAFTAFFRPTSDLNYHVELSFYDHALQQEAEEREAANAEKKRAKKHRRQMTLSSTTSASEMSVDSMKPEDEEAIKARRRAKSKAKKKALKDKKKKQKQQQQQLKKGNGEIALKPSSADKDEEECKNKLQGRFQIMGRCGSHHLLVNDEGTPSLVRFLNLLPSSDAEADTNKPSQDHDSVSTISDESCDSGDGSGLRVVHASSMEDVHREVRRAKGPVLVAGPDDIRIQDETEGNAEIEQKISGLEL